MREYVYVFAAVCSAIGKMSSLILSGADVDMMNIFLRQVSDDFDGYFIIMQVDGASWHRSNKLQVPENIKLIVNPPYSPEVNPTELIWRELRQKDLANIFFNYLDDVIETLIVGLRSLINNSDSLKSLTYFNHLNIVL